MKDSCVFVECRFHLTEIICMRIKVVMCKHFASFRFMHILTLCSEKFEIEIVPLIRII